MVLRGCVSACFGDAVTDDRIRCADCRFLAVSRCVSPRGVWAKVLKSPEQTNVVPLEARTLLTRCQGFEERK